MQDANARLDAADYEISVVRDGSGLATFASEIDSLAARAIESNVFYESWMLASALTHFSNDDARVVLVRHRREGVTGVFPFQLKRAFRGLPLRALHSWQHPYCFLCTPLVSERRARATVRALFSWLESGDAPARIVELDLVSGDGPFWTLFRHELETRGKDRAGDGWATRQTSYERATFTPGVGMHTGVSGKHLKELRRVERKLAEHGELTYRILRADEPPGPWIDQFLKLEESGWKGREGTALASDTRSRAFFANVATRAAERQQMQMMAIELDGAPVAMKCNFVTANSGFAFKIAYSETFAKYSPGVLLELFNMRNLVANCPEMRSMDSCAVADHFMINRLWTGRRTITTCVMAHRGPAVVLVKRWAQLRRLKREVLRWRSDTA